MENTPKEWNGKEYTSYEASQKQRQMERNIRAQKQKINLLELAEASEDDILAAKSRCRKAMSDYVDFSTAMGLPQQKQRLRAGEKIKSSGNGKVIPITKGYIDRVALKEVPGLGEKEIYTLQEAHKKVLETAMKENGSKETAFLLGDDMELLRTVFGNETEIDLSVSERHKARYVIHNHPDNASFSNRDVFWFANNFATQYFSIVKNSGNTELLYKTSKFDRDKLVIEYKRLVKKYKKEIEKNENVGYDIVTRELLRKNKSGLVYVR